MASEYTDSGSAARFFKTCQFAEEELCEKNAQSVQYAESQPGSCGIPTAQEVAETRPSDSNQEELPHTQVCIGDSNVTTLFPKIVLSVGESENIGTIQTTKILLKSSGCASLATINNTPGTERSGQRRFVYCPKASRKEREMGCEGMEERHVTCRPLSDDEDDRTIQERLHGRKARNHHPTVKPLALMRYLCRLVTPPGGLILDPFMGSGTTLIAA